MPPTYDEYLEAQSQLEQQPATISFEQLQQCSEIFTKTLSAYNENLGGALVPPPAFGPKLPLRRNQPSVIDRTKIKELRSKYSYKRAMSTVANAGEFLAEKWQQLEPHHGRRQALMLAVAMISSSPLPGNIAEIIAAAEAKRGVHTYFKKDLQEYATKGWVTIGGGPCKEGRHCGGTRVFIDGSGNITKGPPKLRDKPLKRSERPKPQDKLEPEQRKTPEPNISPKTPEEPKPQKQEIPEPTPQDVERASELRYMEQSVYDIADKYGYPKEKIRISKERGRAFEVGGQPFEAAGECNLATGQIDMYLGSIKSELDTRRVASHEIMHGRYQAVKNNYNDEARKIRRDPAAIKMSGELKPEYQAQYLTYAKLAPLLTGENLQKMIAEDGFTPYSKVYWKDYAIGKVTLQIAIHETLAEMAGSYEASGSTGGGKTFKKLYREVDSLYHNTVYKKQKKK